MPLTLRQGIATGVASARCVRRTQGPSRRSKTRRRKQRALVSTPMRAKQTCMSRSSALEILRRIKPQLQSRYPLSRLALFGSTARGEAGERSDVDVLVDVDPSIGLRFVDLATDIEEALGQPADVVSRRAIDPARWAMIQPELADA
jgi:predicted nucleotidyltransferase